MRGILAWSAYVPFWRLDRSAIDAAFGTSGRRGRRAVAGFDQDTTTMGVEAARAALAATAAEPDVVWFATPAPAYLDQTNANVIHAACRLDPSVAAYDAGTATRATSGLLRTTLSGSGTALVVAADQRTGRATSAEESDSADAAAAVVIGSETADGPPVLAACIGGWCTTAVVADRWRAPNEATSRTWEERFADKQLGEAADSAWRRALDGAGLDADAIDHLVVAGLSSRANASFARRCGVSADTRISKVATDIGNSGAAGPLIGLIDALEAAEPDQVIAVVSLADGADVTLFRTTDAIADHRPTVALSDRLARTADVAYGRFLSWTGQLEAEPPNRPAPDRPSASVAARRTDWKYGLVGSADPDGNVHLPPERASMAGDRPIDQMTDAPRADSRGTVVATTVDRLVYSPSPPVTFAVVDLDEGGRTAVEVTDLGDATLAAGDRVAFTFRRLGTSPDGIHNYFWKAVPTDG